MGIFFGVASRIDVAYQLARFDHLRSDLSSKVDTKCLTKELTRITAFLLSKLIDLFGEIFRKTDCKFAALWLCRHNYLFVSYTMLSYSTLRAQEPAGGVHC